MVINSKAIFIIEENNDLNKVFFPYMMSIVEYFWTRSIFLDEVVLIVWLLHFRILRINDVSIVGLAISGP